LTHHPNNLKLQETKSKDEELKKYHALVLAAIDYQIELLQSQPIQGFDLTPGYERAKIQAEEDFSKGRLTNLKSWYRNMTEGIREGREFKFNAFVKKRTGYTIDIFKEHFNRVDKVIAKGKITSDSQFYEVNSMVDYLSHIEPIDEAKIKVLNSLLIAYEQRKRKAK
jgi:hypothetical protein